MLWGLQMTPGAGAALEGHVTHALSRVFLTFTTHEALGGVPVTRHPLHPYGRGIKSHFTDERSGLSKYEGGHHQAASPPLAVSPQWAPRS